jgi:hypothetical protein
MNSSAVRFSEVQYFRQWWLWLLLVGTAVATVGVFGYGVFVQFILGRPWGGNPMSDTWLIVSAIAVVGLELALLALFAVAHLRTEAREDGLYVRFFPFHLSYHRLPLADVREVRAVTYSATMEYGGWGIRYGWWAPCGTSGKAYNVSGNRGVRLTYHTGGHLLIGSQEPEALAEAVRSLHASGAGTHRAATKR